MFNSSVGFEQKYSNKERLFMSASDKEKLLEDESIAKAKQRMVRKERVSQKTPLLFEAQKPVQVEIDGEVKTFKNVIAKHEMETPVIDESVPSLIPLAVTMVECPYWPFKGKNSRAGFRPEFANGVWEHVFDYGMYCVKCFSRHETEWPDECSSCGLTKLQSSQAIQHLENVAFLWYKNREQRRRQQLRRTGLHIPDGVKL